MNDIRFYWSWGEPYFTKSTDDVVFVLDPLRGWIIVWYHGERVRYLSEQIPSTWEIVGQ